MKYISTTVLLAFLLMLLQCGGSNLEEGDASYAAGEYTQAINKYLAFKKSNPDNSDVNGKIALAYFNKGKQLYGRSKNIDAYAGNFEKAQNYFDESTLTANQKSEYSLLLLDLASAYYRTKPINDIQKEQYFNNTLDYLSMAIENDPANTAADSMRNKIYMDNFQKMFDQGMKFYNQAKKEKNNADLYLSAENYFTKAVKFKEDDAEAIKYLNASRNETLGILQNIYPLSFCVPSYKIQKNVCYAAIAVKNYSNDPIIFDLNDLTLNTEDGQTINVDLKKTAELEKAMPETSTLKAWALLDGQVVFTLPGNVQLETITYNHNNEKTVKKYFPQ
jgi:tetratricopeptide (TPR) repeat protein